MQKKFIRLFLFSLALSASSYASDTNALLHLFRKKNIPKQTDTESMLAQMRDQGVDFSPSLFASSGWDVAGGRKRTTDGNLEYLLDLNLKLQSDKIAGFKGGIFSADFQLRRGGHPAQDAGSFEFLSLIEANNLTQLSELWYRQSFGEDLFWFKVGKNDCSLYFDYANNGSYFQNSGFEGLSTIRILPAYPNPSMGVIVGSTPVDFIAIKAGLFDGSLILGNQTGSKGIFGEFFTDLSAHAFMVGQIDFSWNLKSGLTGRVGVGGWHNTAHLPNYNKGTSKGVQGGYVVVDQTVWQSSVKNSTSEIGAFFQIGFTSPKPNPVKQAYAAGMSWIGMFPKRPNDVFGFGASMERFSLEPGSGYVKPAEVDLEVFYVYIPKRWLNIQPDVQYIINPGGSGVNNAFVLLLDAAVSF
ncbi:MAG: carbohydrate porin [Chlamydiae bacterium]|nr:carbohydrate porin [Chlamydiota bacterium]